MTRAARWLTTMAHTWSRRPSAPPAAWIPPERAWYPRFPYVLALREGLSTLYERGEVTWGWIADADGSAWVPREDPSFGRVIWCDDPFGARFPEALGRIVGDFETLVRRGSRAPGLRAIQGFDPHDRTVGVRRFPPLVSRERVVWHAPVVLYPEQLPGGCLRACRVPIVRARTGDPDRVSVLPAAFWPPELVTQWSAGDE